MKGHEAQLNSRFTFVSHPKGQECKKPRKGLNFKF